MKKTKKSKNNRRFLWPAVCLLLFALCLGLGVSLVKVADTIWKYELLEDIDNQACRYLTWQSSVNGSFNLNASAKADEPKLVYKCMNGQTTTARKIQGKNIKEYELGATVMYFSNNEEAERYAEKNLNPLRYWGVDEEGQSNGGPQTSRFTFIISDEPVPYFDAYTVKANAVLRVSLPCYVPSEVSVDCQEEANSILKNELKGINVL